jgi:tetratricopeptide (TPR) repeat protein
VQPAAAQGGRGGGGRGGRGGAPALDFASDEKPQKAVAREMMRMVGELGPRVAAAAGRSADAAAEVTCITCHRGVPVPKQLPAILDETTAEKGTPAAIARYKELRRQFFGAQAYDFTQGTLLAYAQRATQANTPEDAIAWLQLNLDYFPLSSPTYVALAQAYQKANDTAAAVKALERAVELDPQNAQTKRQLDQLKGVAPQVTPSQ